jgi:hypothetical protein
VDARADYRGTGIDGAPTGAGRILAPVPACSTRRLCRIVMQDRRRLPARFHARLSATFDAGPLAPAPKLSA